MQILHLVPGSIHQYLRDIRGSCAADRYRPDRCPLCLAWHSFLAHGFYYRTLADTDFDQLIPVRRYLCRLCRRTVSRLPDFVLPYLRHSITIISLFLVRRAQLRRSGASSSSAQHALSAWAVLGTSLSKTGGGVMRRLGQLDGGDPRSGFRESCPANARSGWLDRGPSVPIRSIAYSLSGLAAFSYSQERSFQFPAPGRHLLRTNTQHLHRREPPGALRCCAQGGFPMESKADKTALFRYGLVAPLILEPLPRGELPPGPRDR